MRRGAGSDPMPVLLTRPAVRLWLDGAARITFKHAILIFNGQYHSKYADFTLIRRVLRKV